jgi:hypothetical protein
MLQVAIKAVWDLQRLCAHTHRHTDTPHTHTYTHTHTHTHRHTYIHRHTHTDKALGTEPGICKVITKY